ncbi:hypothetical protein ISN45_Aa06g032300 [Arabidopsis thaliana x Arabidopsis arenosa]|uniref:Zinc knuckle CX2CX4HX4C domain-containing protein n=1 Tax=Arabidopsis thaliana x Arabidopsis arenosa TaxID=1240361 RepID=A0A8T1Z1U5_9BRAS|nr:hypothetical protein ISN45_Aa06g032300 [Arabidopsis thaliana x Arabidopsis arenosa]
MKNSLRNGQAIRDSPSSEDDEPIQLPALDNSALINRFRFTVVGRVFHTNGRSMEAFLAFMPSAGIWDVEGRARGFDLGNGRFHFNFESEEDLQKILKKRPCHFNKWTFSLERWELNFQEDLLSYVTFWVKIRDLLLRCWVEEAFRGIDEAIGHVSEVDVAEARVLVSVNVTKPLKFKKRVLTDNGEEVMVSLTYEKLFRFCFTCNMISHEERDCPHLSETQKKLNKERRSGTFADGSRRAGEDHDLTGHRDRVFRDGDRNKEERRGAVRDLRRRSTSELSSRTTTIPSQSTNPSGPRQVRRSLYLPQEAPRAAANRNPVWQRIGGEVGKTQHRNREPSIQSSSGSRKKTDDEPHKIKEMRRSREGHRNPSRRRESPLRIRSPIREEPSLENWRSSRRPPRHQSSRDARDPMAHRDFPSGCGTHLAVKEKGKGKMVEAEEDRCLGDDDEDLEIANPVPVDFEFGSGSGVGDVGEPRAIEPTHPQADTTPQVNAATNPVGKVVVDTLLEEAT